MGVGRFEGFEEFVLTDFRFEGRADVEDEETNANDVVEDELGVGAVAM